jgi:hypothetical protein
MNICHELSGKNVPMEQGEDTLHFTYYQMLYDHMYVEKN